MAADQPDWSAFHKAALSRPPRELLRRTLGCFQVERRQPGVAIDLGCGSGTDSLDMIRRGWEVHAVDADPAGLEMLVQSVPPDLRHKLHTHAERFELFDLPACDLIWAGYSLPFYPRESWPGFWQRALDALKPDGRFAGDLFGEKHAFASEADVFVLSEVQARSALSTLVVEAFDIEDGWRPSGQELTRWHAFGFAARKARDAE